jgi:hypothetical protein
MSDEKHPKEQPEATQVTSKGTEIPVPTRRSIFDALKKVVRPEK